MISYTSWRSYFRTCKSCINLIISFDRLGPTPLTRTCFGLHAVHVICTKTRFFLRSLRRYSRVSSTSDAQRNDSSAKGELSAASQTIITDVRSPLPDPIISSRAPFSGHKVKSEGAMYWSDLQPYGDRDLVTTAAAAATSVSKWKVFTRRCRQHQNIISPHVLIPAPSLLNISRKKTHKAMQMIN